MELLSERGCDKEINKVILIQVFPRKKIKHDGIWANNLPDKKQAPIHMEVTSWNIWVEPQQMHMSPTTPFSSSSKMQQESGLLAWTARNERNCSTCLFITKFIAQTGLSVTLFSCDETCNREKSSFCRKANFGKMFMDCFLGEEWGEIGSDIHKDRLLSQ